MKKVLVLITIGTILVLCGCSRKFVAIKLDDAVQSTWDKLGAIHCKNSGVVIDGSNVPSVTYQVLTGYQLNVGAAAGVIPLITLSGQTSLSESTTITVKFDLSKYSCQRLGTEALNVEALPTPIKLYEYDADTGSVKPAATN